MSLFHPLKFNLFVNRLNDMFWRGFVRLFGMTLSFLYGVIAGVSLLGFLGIYRPLPGILVSIAISAIVYYWFATHAELRLIESIQKKLGLHFRPGWNYY